MKITFFKWGHADQFHYAVLSDTEMLMVQYAPNINSYSVTILTPFPASFRDEWESVTEADFIAAYERAQLSITDKFLQACPSVTAPTIKAPTEYSFRAQLNRFEDAQANAVKS